VLIEGIALNIFFFRIERNSVTQFKHIVCSVQLSSSDQLAITYKVRCDHEQMDALKHRQKNSFSGQERICFGYGVSVDPNLLSSALA